MGTNMAPSYADTFMGKFESSIERPLSWYRFIDDVDMKWTLFKDLSVEQIRLILRA
jgi:hypothetical protein